MIESVLTEMNPLNIIFCSLMSLADMTLTYYILWYDKKLHPTKPKFVELNPLARYIMKITNMGPIGLILSASVSQILIIEVAKIAPQPIGYFAVVFMSGAIFLAIWIHTHSITTLHKYAKNRKTIREILGEPLGHKD